MSAKSTAKTAISPTEEVTLITATWRMGAPVRNRPCAGCAIRVRPAVGTA
jgi:hypothetical protein